MSSRILQSTAKTCFPSSTSSSGLRSGLHRQSLLATTIPRRCASPLAPTTSLRRARPPRSLPLLNLIAHRHHRHCTPSPLPRVAGATRTRVRYLDQRTRHCTLTGMAGTVYRPYHRPRLTWDRLRMLFPRRPSFHDLSEPLGRRCRGGAGLCVRCSDVIVVIASLAKLDIRSHIRTCFFSSLVSSLSVCLFPSSVFVLSWTRVGYRSMRLHCCVRYCERLSLVSILDWPTEPWIRFQLFAF